MYRRLKKRSESQDSLLHSYLYYIDKTDGWFGHDLDQQVGAKCTQKEGNDRKQVNGGCRKIFLAISSAKQAK